MYYWFYLDDNNLELIERLSTIFHFLKSIGFSKSNHATIIICFDGVVSHGGLLDRLKGVISFYEVAKKKNVDFKIHFNHPFHLSRVNES